MWECRKKKKSCCYCDVVGSSTRNIPITNTHDTTTFESLCDFFFFFFSPKGASAHKLHSWQKNSWRFTHLNPQLSRVRSDILAGGRSFTHDFSYVVVVFPNTQRSSLRGKKASPDASRLHVKRRNVASCERRCCSASPRALIQSLGRNLCTDMTLQLSASSARGGEYACTGDPHGNEAGEAFLKLKLNLGQGQDWQGLYNRTLTAAQQPAARENPLLIHPCTPTHLLWRAGFRGNTQTVPMKFDDRWFMENNEAGLMNHPGWEWYFIFQQAVNPIRTCWMFRRLCTWHDISW